ncbi:phage lytic cycle repressor MrpR family protein [Heyndrickxia camelliae]|uniref:MrpR N-terminal core-binding domain-containing protein n=1 Tax=Heyndrickxia camelliae TaxID=1707093 RepID=A0A2N3LF74_9BACI|nr:hypothetical protein [Heyndrickxia camelliae]PKR83249.1 hypothetical protein CWO92_19795 [Heyndrickxia camelliae]
MYNETIKKKYLNNNKNALEKLFSLSSHYEEMYKTDLCDFNLTQFKIFISETRNKSKEDLFATVDSINDYVDWSIREGIKKSNINPLAILDEEWMDDFF